jgi:ferredoxin
MATIITEECINCGACEPECPNAAIYQGGVEYEYQGAKHAPLSQEFFYIVAEKCTECVGFFEQEACAAVCPVDCCVTDPERVEEESVLLARSRELHPDKDIADDGPSRFRPGSGAGVTGAGPSPPQEGSGDAGSEQPDEGAQPPAGAGVVEGRAKAVVEPLESFEIALICSSCDGEYAAAFRFMSPGTVLRCPHCQYAFSSTQRIFLALSERLERFGNEMNQEIDRHGELAEMEDRRFGRNTKKLRAAAVVDAKAIVAQHTEAPKRSMFG